MVQKATPSNFCQRASILIWQSAQIWLFLGPPRQYYLYMINVCLANLAYTMLILFHYKFPRILFFSIFLGKVAEGSSDLLWSRVGRPL